MCGACPGGARLSEATTRIGLARAADRAGRFLARLTGERLRIEAFGDGWSLAAPTGGLRVYRAFEDLVSACAPRLDPERIAAARAECADADDSVRDLVLRLAEAAAPGRSIDDSIREDAGEPPSGNASTAHPPH